MAVVETLKIDVVADTKQPSAALQVLTNNLAKFEAALKKATSGGEVTYLTRNIEILKGQMADLGKEAGGKFTKGANQANNALMNLGRVAQDAPFGFIGIQNNLNPLLESFQRLKQETGSSGSALKALGSSLMGAGGLGFALSAASALFLVFGDSMFSASASAKAFAESQKAYADSMSKAVGDTAKETANLKALALIVNDTTKSTQERTRALDQLKESYQGNIDLQKIDINDGAKLTGIINTISEALLRKARANAFANLIAEEEAKKARLQTQSTDELAGKVGFLSKTWSVLKTSVSSFGSASGAANAAIDVTQKALAEVSKETLAADKNIQTYTTLLNANTMAQISNNDSLTLSNDKLESQVEKYSKINEYLKFYTQFYAGLAKVRKDVSGSPIGDENIRLRSPEMNAPISVGSDSKVNKILEIENATKKAADATKLYGEQVALANQITSVSAQKFTDLGQALLQGQSIGDALGNVFKKLTIDIAAAALKALIFQTILAVVTGGTSMIAGSFGKTFAGFLGIKLADGGITNGPTPALIGEAGPEAVIPLDRLGAFIDRAAKIGATNSMGSASTGESRVMTRLTGQDLLLWIERSQMANNYRR